MIWMEFDVSGVSRLSIASLKTVARELRVQVLMREQSNENSVTLN